MPTCQVVCVCVCVFACVCSGSCLHAQKRKREKCVVTRSKRAITPLPSRPCQLRRRRAVAILSRSRAPRTSRHDLSIGSLCQPWLTTHQIQHLWTTDVSHSFRVARQAVHHVRSTPTLHQKRPFHTPHDAHTHFERSRQLEWEQSRAWRGSRQRGQGSKAVQSVTEQQDGPKLSLGHIPGCRKQGPDTGHRIRLLTLV